jgi:WD40 repeat protein
MHYERYLSVIRSIAVLRDSTVITGDSRGQVQIWDGNVGVLTASFMQHSADVLCVIASDDESKIFASGIDGKVVCLQRPMQPTDPAEVVDESLSQQWVYMHSHRTHTHDVFALAIVSRKHSKSVTSSSGACSGSSLVFPGKVHTLLSGGLDARLSLYAVEDFDRVRPQWLPIIPANELIAHNSAYSLITLRHKQHVDIWQVKLQTPQQSVEEVSLSSSTSPSNLSEHCSRVLRLKTAGHDHLHTVALSPDGSLLALSTLSESKLWRISVNEQNVSLSKVVWPESLVQSGRKSGSISLRSLTFSPDGRWLAAWHATKKSILLFSITSTKKANDDKDMVKLVASLPFDPHSIDNGSENDEVDRKLSHVVRCLVFSSDSKYLAVSNATNEVTIYNVSK